MPRKKGGSCHSCGKLIEDGISVLMYAVCHLTGVLLNVFHFHSRLSARKLQNNEEKALGTAHRGCLDHSLLRRGANFAIYRVPTVSVGVLDGDTQDMLNLLDIMYPVRAKEASDSMHDILVSYCSATMNHFTYPIDRFSYLQRDAVERLIEGVSIAENRYGKGKVVPLLHKSARCAYYDVTLPGVSIGQIKLSRANTELLANFGVWYLQMVSELTQIPNLKWNMQNSRFFLQTLRNRNYSMDVIQCLVVPFLRSGALKKTDAMKQLHSDIDAVFTLALKLSSIKQLNWDMPTASQFLQALLDRHYSMSDIETVVMPLLHNGTLTNTSGIQLLHADIDAIINNVNRRRTRRI